MKLSGYKKTIVILFACIITIIVALNVFTEEEVPLTDFIVEDLYIVLGETETIEVTTVPSNATIAGKFTFDSSDLAVASVGEADGIITGCTPGFSEITVGI